MKNLYTAQSGRSMIEMLGVLAVIGVLTVGGFGLVSKVSNSHKSNVTIDEIGTLANKARVVFRDFVLDNPLDSNSTSAQPMNEFLCTAKAYPESLEYPKTSDGKCGADGTFTSNIDVKYSVNHFKNNQIDYFYIEISQLSDEMCMAIAQSSWGSPSLNGYVGVCVGSSCSNGGVIGNTNPGTNVAKGGAKLSIDGASAACNNESAADGAGNHVFLTFR